MKGLSYFRTDFRTFPTIFIVETFNIKIINYVKIPKSYDWEILADLPIWWVLVSEFASMGNRLTKTRLPDTFSMSTIRFLRYTLSFYPLYKCHILRPMPRKCLPTSNSWLCWLSESSPKCKSTWPSSKWESEENMTAQIALSKSIISCWLDQILQWNSHRIKCIEEILNNNFVANEW